MTNPATHTSIADLERRRCLGGALALGAVAALGDTTQADTLKAATTSTATWGGSGSGLADLRDPRQLCRLVAAVAAQSKLKCDPKPEARHALR